MTLCGAPLFVTARCDGADYTGLVADWDQKLAITEDFELVTPEHMQPRTVESYTNVLMHLSEGMPVTYRGPGAVGTIPAHIAKLTKYSITIRDARSPFTTYDHVPLDRLSYRMNYDTVLPSGEALECTIDTLHRVAKYDGLKVVTNPPHMSHCPPRYWVVPNTSMDKASKTIKTFGPGQLWKAKKTQPMKRRNYVLNKSPIGSKKKVSRKQPSMDMPAKADALDIEKEEKAFFFDLNDSDSE
eukprot:4870416-Prymnesium_polylepis.1